MICQGVAMLLSAVLGIVTLAGAMTAELLVALTFFGGVVIGFNQPSRLALVSSLVPRESLTTAVATNSSDRSEERRVGKGCVSECRSRWRTDPDKKNIRKQEV